MRRTSLLLAAGALAALTTMAHAADRPQTPRTYYVPPQKVEVFNWTGLYAGGSLNYVHVGDCSGRTGTFFGLSLSGDCSGDGFGAGIAAMGLYQPHGSQWTVGGRVMYEWLNAGGSSPISLNGPAGCVFCGPLAGTRFEGELERSLTLSGLLGYNIRPRTLLYVHGGWKHSQANVSASVLGTRLSASGSHNGWEVGLGVMQELAQNLSVGLEYAYADHQAKTYNLSGGGVIVPTRFDPGDSHTVRFSLNYRFNFPG